MTGQSKAWVFTINNWTNNERDRLVVIGQHELHNIDYMVFGYERGANGTPHLQGFVLFDRRRRLNQVKDVVGNRAYVARCNGTYQQASSYCKKDGVFNEYGSLPDQRPRGTGGQFAEFTAWVGDFHATKGHAPTDRDVANSFPALYVRYARNLCNLANHVCPRPVLQDGGNLKPWQSEVVNYVGSEVDNRSIRFMVDPEGGNGKSWLQRYLYSKEPEKVQLLSVAKRDDIAHSIQPECSVFLFNVPRTQMELLRYEILEQLKDGYVYSPKYNSRMKIMVSKVIHVIVFSNEAPDYTKMTDDRYDVINLS